MKKLALIIIIILPAILIAQAKPGKIVVVVGSYGNDTGKIRPGFNMEEFAQATESRIC